MKTLPVIGLAALATFTVSPVFAGDVSYPSANPSLKFTVPDGYQCNETKSGVLMCSSTGGWHIRVQPLKVASKSDLKSTVSEVLQWQVTEAAAKEFKPGAIEEKNGKGIGHGDCKYIDSDPKEAPTPYVLTAVVIDAGGKMFQLTNTTVPAEATKREADLKIIIDSLKPAGGSVSDAKPRQEDTKKDAASDDEEESKTSTGLGGGDTAKPSPSP